MAPSKRSIPRGACRRPRPPGSARPAIFARRQGASRHSERRALSTANIFCSARWSSQAAASSHTSTESRGESSEEELFFDLALHCGTSAVAATPVREYISPLYDHSVSSRSWPASASRLGHLRQAREGEAVYPRSALGGHADRVSSFRFIAADTPPPARRRRSHFFRAR